jgi:hypothetical protein
VSFFAHVRCSARALNSNVDLNHDVVLAKVASKIDELVDLRLAQIRPRPAALSLEEH